MSIEFPDWIKPSEAQLARALSVLPTFDEDYNEYGLQQLTLTGRGYFRDVEDLTAHAGMRCIDSSSNLDDRNESIFLSFESNEPLDALCVRIDYYVDKSEDNFGARHVDVFLYRIEDRPQVERALVHEVASRQINDLVNRFDGSDVDVLEVLREAIVASPVGARLLSEEASRMIRTSIDTPDQRQQTAAPKIRKQGL